MSKTSTLYPIVTALVKAEELDGVGAGRTWLADRPLQTEFLSRFFERCRDEAASIPEIESVVSRQADEINAFLRSKGFSIQLDQFPPDGFGTASVQNTLVEWEAAGEVVSITSPSGQNFPGVRILEARAQFYRSAVHPYPVAVLRTKSGDQVSLTIAAEPGEGLVLTDAVKKISARQSGPLFFSGVRFPMVDYDQKVDISWLPGMTTRGVDGKPIIIEQALQQTKFRMNEIGARAESGVALGMKRGMVQVEPDMIIDRPFYVWVERPGLNMPLFAGYITEEDWKKPISL